MCEYTIVVQDMQIQIPLFTNIKTILLYGYGVEGQSTQIFLKKWYPGIKIAVYDQGIEKYSKPKNPEKYDLTIVSPGVDPKKLEQYSLATFSSNTEVFFQHLSEKNRKKILGITGTKGKSTTVKYLYDILGYLNYKVAVGGNYGVGMLELIDQIEELDYIVLELSSFQLEKLTYSPHFAGFVNLYEDHLDRHESMEEYFQAKANIFKHQKAGDLLFIPDTYTTFLEPAKGVFRSMDGDEEGRVVVTRSVPEEYFPDGSMLRAPHMRSNLGIVAEMVRILASSDSQIESKIKEFSLQFIPLPHRLELVKEIQGRRFVNDSQSTNQYSTIAGMQAFQADLGVLIIGGKDKGNRYDLLIDQVLKQQPFLVVLDTEVGATITELLEKNNYEHYVVVKNFPDAVKMGYQFTEAGKVCLLSPAAASFDWFQNYKDRGDQFRKLVEKLV